MCISYGFYAGLFSCVNLMISMYEIKKIIHRKCAYGVHASSTTHCKFLSYPMSTSSLVNALAAFGLFPLLCSALLCFAFLCPRLSFTSFAWSPQTLPCLVKFFVVDNAHGIFAFCLI